MNPDKEDNKIIKGSENIGKFISENLITDQLNLGEDIELMSYKKSKEDTDNNSFINGNISVVISASITAYARILMSNIKIKYKDHLYYSDTDSIDLDIKLPSKYVSDELGDFKHEMTFKKALYLAPKVYAGVTEDKGEYLITIKGYKQDVMFKDMENLSLKDKQKHNQKMKKLFKDLENVLIKDNKYTFKQKKLYKKFSEGKITTKQENYTLILNENKRKLIFNNNKFNDTVPYVLRDGKLI